MSHPSFTPPVPLSEKRTLSLDEFHALGGPGRTKCYALSKEGKLRLVRDPAGRTRITAAEAARFFSAGEPIRSRAA